MDAQTTHEAIAKLLALELITQEQANLLLQLPQATNTLTVNSPGEILGWMIERDMLTEDGLLALWDETPLSLSEEQLEQREEIIDVAIEKLDDFNTKLSLKTLAILRDELILSEDQFNRLLACLPFDDANASPTDAIVWLVVNHWLTDEEWLAIHAETEKDRNFASAHKRVAMLTEATLKIQEHRTTEEKLSKKKLWNSFIPGAGSLFVIFFAGLSIGIFYFLSKPTPTPQCNAKNIVKTVNNMLLQAKWSVPSRTTYSMLNMPKGIPRLKNTQEIGYAIDDKTRGCIAEIEWNGSVTPYGYTIKPYPDKRGEFEVAGANSEILKARYGHLDAQGRFANQAEPVGRDVLVNAIRLGLESLPKSDYDTGLIRQLAAIMRPSRNHATDNTPQINEIEDIEPLGSCQVLNQGKSYTCEVLLVRHDALLAAMGRSSLLTVKSSFTVERYAGETGWKVSDKFPQEFKETVIRSRQAVITGSQQDDAKSISR